MISIQRPTKSNTTYRNYCQLINEEWPEGPSNDEFFLVPKPILLHNNDRLIGGLTFTRLPLPNKRDIEVPWINTLFVKPEFRGKKFANTLVKEAVRAIRESAAPNLYVYTDIAGFYQKHGWVTLSENGRFSILRLTID